ncbi:MAG: zinc metallopeptidase [Clostridiales bacterium]|nr:zinc metallopeptidase [Clostridiales bacterium]
MPYFYDPTYIIIIPAIIFALIAQINVTSTFQKYSKVRNARGFTGRDVARQILDNNGLYNVRIEQVSGNLSDHYDPRNNVVRLSDSVYNSSSVAAIGVAAHEVGHAIQHSQGYTPIKIRSAIIPVSQIGSSLAVPLVILGLILSIQPFITFGILLFTTVVFFQAITLPVEFNASRRALATLRDNFILDGEELSQSKKVLTAAALTYVAALFSSLMSLLRLILLSGRRKR